MVEITISFPKELKGEIESHPEIDWALIFKKAAVKLLRRLELAEFIETKLDKSEFTEQGSLRLGELVKERRLKQLISERII